MPVGITTKNEHQTMKRIGFMPVRFFLRSKQSKKGGHITKIRLTSFTGEKDVKVEELILNEVKRLAEVYNKTFLDCENIIELTGLGRDNVRALMNSKVFPATQIGNRKIVSILAFVTWQMTQ